MNKLIVIVTVLFGISLNLSSASADSKWFSADYKMMQKTDTVFANKVLSNTALLMETHYRYTMLIYANHSYKSIKLLDREIKIKGNKLSIIQKLFDGPTVNTDSVILNRQTLMPVESYSDISTSKDSFIYKRNRITGTMTAIAGNQKRSFTKIDTSFSKPMFNGLAYIETYQSLNYKKGLPFILAQYVPGHSASYERVVYVKDDEITVDGINLPAMVLEIKKTDKITIHCWLSTKTREILKIEGEFPGFTYYLLRL